MISLLAQTLLIAGLLSAVVLVVGPLLRLSPAVRFGLWLVVLIKLLTPPLVEWPWDVGAFLSAVLPEGFQASSACPECPVAVMGPVDATSLGIESTTMPGLGSLLGLCWVLGSLLVVARWVSNISRFQLALTASDPAPERIVRLIECVARRFGMPAPRARVAPISSGPFVWSPKPCCGSPDARLERIASCRLSEHLTVAVLGLPDD